MTTPAARTRATSSRRTSSEAGRPARATWGRAAAETVLDLANEVDKRFGKLRDASDPDDVHDARTATRRLRTAATIYREALGKRRLRKAEGELRRVAGLLGAVRDLDVMLGTLDEWERAAKLEHGEVTPLRRALKADRATAETRLRAELDRARTDRSLRRMTSLADRAAVRARGVHDGDDPPVEASRVADRAPAVIWRAFGDLLDHRVRPEIADPAAIHRMRLSAKKLRYTLEAFDDLLRDSFARRIEQVTAVQDSAGEMHDAVVAAERARGLLADDHLRSAERDAIERFASDQDARAAELRPRIARGLSILRGDAFREDLGRAVVAMG